MNGDCTYVEVGMHTCLVLCNAYDTGAVYRNGNLIRKSRWDGRNDCPISASLRSTVGYSSCTYKLRSPCFLKQKLDDSHTHKQITLTNPCFRGHIPPPSRNQKPVDHGKAPICAGIQCGPAVHQLGPGCPLRRRHERHRLSHAD
jgi:hypothetical protein